MRVLQVTTHMNIGGIANYIVLLAKELKRKSVDCSVASAGGELEDSLDRFGIPHKALPIRTKFEFGPRVLRSAFGLARIIKEDRVDIIHAHTRVSQAAAFFASRMTGVAYLSTCHGFFKKRLGRRLFDLWGDKVIAISKPVMDSLVLDFKVPPDRIALIHNGVDFAKFSKEYSEKDISDLKKSLGLEGAAVIGTIGRLSPVKGHRFFIEALKAVLSKGHRVKGLIIGSGPEKAALKAMAKRSGIEDLLLFIPSATETYPYLGIMDIFVFPSVREGLGLSLLEAMAAGRPCVASNVGGISDIIRDGENGILCDAGDAEALAGAIIGLLANEPLRKRLGSAAKNLSKKQFSLEAMADRVIELYKEVLKDHAKK